MKCTQCQAIEDFHNPKVVKKELARYLKKGPEKATQILTEAIQREGVKDLTLLDIGGGVGAIQHALLQSGASSAVGVDASRAFVQAAQAEAQRRNLADRVSNHYGNFVEMAGTIPPADIVTLDKVICCYPDMEALAELSSDRARKIYGLVYPIDSWWTRLIGKLENFYFKIVRNPFRIFIHSDSSIQTILANKGFTRRFYRRHNLWQIAVYTR